MLLTEDMFDEFKRKYKEAKKEKKKTFNFMDQEVLVSYAKYVIAYNQDFRKVRK